MLSAEVNVPGKTCHGLDFNPFNKGYCLQVDILLVFFAKKIYIFLSQKGALALAGSVAPGRTTA